MFTPASPTRRGTSWPGHQIGTGTGKTPGLAEGSPIMQGRGIQQRESGTLTDSWCFKKVAGQENIGGQERVLSGLDGFKMPLGCSSSVGTELNKQPSAVAPNDPTYLRLLHTLRNYPDTEDFVYLRRVKFGPANYNPYALEVVNFAEADSEELYTLSARGVTQHRGGGISEFATLDQWERELSLFNALRQLAVFRQFRSWKHIRLWRKAVTQTKFNRAVHALQEQLFLLSPALTTHVQSLKGLCQGLNDLTLLQLQSHTALTLQDFCKAQAEVLALGKTRLAAFGAAASTAVVLACQAAADMLAVRLTEFHSRQDETAQQDVAVHAHTLRALRKYEFCGRPKSCEFTYTAGAAHRSELRRLRCFVRMADYMVVDVLQGVLLDSISGLLKALSLHPDMPTIAKSPRNALAGPNQGAGTCNALIRVKIVLGDAGQEPHFSPSLVDFQAELQRLVASWMDCLGGVQRLWDVEDIAAALAGEGDDAKKPTPLADLIDGEGFRSLGEGLRNALQAAYKKADDFKQIFKETLHTVEGNAHVDVDALEQAYTERVMCLLDGRPADAAASAPPSPRQKAVTVDTFRALVDNLREQQRELAAMPLQEEVGVLLMDMTQLKAAVEPSAARLLARLAEVLPSTASRLYEAFSSQVHEAISVLSRKCHCAEDYVEKLKFLEDIKARDGALEEVFAEVRALYDLVFEQEMPVTGLEQASYATAVADWAHLHSVLDEVESAHEENVAQFNGELQAGLEEVRVATVEIRNAAHVDMILNDTSDPDVVIAHLQSLKEQMVAHQAAAALISEQQQAFRLSETPNEDLKQTVAEVELRLQLWQAGREWDELQALWTGTPFSALDIASMEAKVAAFHRLTARLEAGLPPNKVVANLCEKVDASREAVPVVAALRNPALKERHWVKIQAAVGTEIGRTEGVTLGSVLAQEVVKAKEVILAISVEATQECTLEDVLAKVGVRWAVIDLPLVPYKDTKDVFVLGPLDDVMGPLEDSMVIMSTVLSSRYVSGVRAEVERVERQLQHLSATLDEWTACQRSWMWLECIFGAPDIQRQLPHEAKSFAAVDRQFRELMRRANARPNALQAAASPGLLETLRRNNEVLEHVGKNLEDYLETKRMAFPRFYFLSNDELLDILAQAKAPQAVQAHVSKCFDNIRRLEFGDDAHSADIIGMVSGEGEHVAFSKALKARGSMDAWLAAVENGMISSLRKIARTAFRSYPVQERGDWLQQQPAQIALVVSQTYWCNGVERCLAGKDPQAALAAFARQCMAQLSSLSSMVRGPLPALHRASLGTLITMDVHARDVVDNLIKHGVRNQADFEWQMQLRYSWSEAADDIIIRQVNARFLYGYEYMGAQGRLVMTPITDRCYMTLTGALHLKLGGAPAGPAGTGKTETIKDLSRALGMNCVVFNSGEALDFRFMGRFFAGLAQSGAWACFDEFNRIDIEVLSVVAQQLLTLQNAMKAELAKFNFEGRSIRLIPTTGVFITMNPGYIGRTELPDNLKALFRPVAMTVPDTSLVAEVLLFSEGFDAPKQLARKVVRAYRLASEQLSLQGHYDWGMRAVRSVLAMAGSLRRAGPGNADAYAVWNALHCSTLPKLVGADIQLFLAILSDLFPGMTPMAEVDGKVARAAVAVLTERGLQAPKPFVDKVVQLHEMLRVRFGVMLLGPAGGGKSTAYRTLQGAVTRLREVDHDPDQAFQAVHAYAFNPKCVSMGELYGEYHPLTNEWQDGLASTLIRGAAADPSNTRKWLILDGPVDPTWIENMNTVLDDNCTLCLPNGERVKLNGETMRLIFEVSDVSMASPATVSRCGMVYLPPDQLGWRPLVYTWAATCLPPGVSQETREYLLDLMEQKVDPGLAFVQSQGEEFIPCTANQMVTSLTHLLQTLMTSGTALDFSLPHTQLQPALSLVFVFSFTWAFGGNLSRACHSAFDKFARTLLEDIADDLPAAGLLFDYYVDLRADKAPELRHLAEKVPIFQYGQGSQQEKTVLVPTLHTKCYSALLEILLDVNRSVMFTGTTGVGKTAIIIDALASLQGTKGVAPHTINFSAQTRARDTQLFIEGKLETKRKTKLGAPADRKVVFFVDDVNMPAQEKYGAQPPIELLRQFQDYKGFYDRKKLFWKDIEDTTLVAACAPPGGGRQPMSQRFTRHFTLLAIPPPSDASITTILSSILSGFLSSFPPDVRALTGSIVAASVEVYNRTSLELLPTPAKIHYMFNMRDLTRLMQGMLMMTPAKCGDASAMARLWVHECLRVFHDRLVSDTDRSTFQNIVGELLQSHFPGLVVPDEVLRSRPLLFADFALTGIPPTEREYEEIHDTSRFARSLEGYVAEYNAAAASPLTLVFFQDAMNHVARIARILRQPQGSAMLVGVAGSGKQSLTRLAAFIGGFKCYQLELRRGYSPADFREDFKSLYNAAGVEGQPVVLLLSDTQIVHEAFLEDINNFLNSGEVPAMFSSEDKDRIFGAMRELVETSGGVPNKENCYAEFIARARRNLHVVLAMSPTGDAFRQRCRAFPSLIACCSIDWFTEWPSDALLSVSSKFLSRVDVGHAAAHAALPAACVAVHNSVGPVADRFYEELRRRYYITPSAYLDLIQVFVALFRAKTVEMKEARDRLQTGLAKLQTANELVDKLQIELSILQPIIQEKTKAATSLLEAVTRDQTEAEKVKTQVVLEEAEVSAFATETGRLAADAKADLNEALPALTAALDSLNALNKQDIIEIKAMLKPPPLVQMTMEAVCVLKGERADWETARKVLSEPTFMKSLFDFDKDNIPELAMKRLQKYLDNPDYTPEAVAKQSKAAQSLCMWTHAMDVYNRVAKVVQPKRAKLRAAETALKEANKKLSDKRASLQAVEDKVSELRQQLKAAQEEQARLGAQAATTQQRLWRAGQLTSSLNEEGLRWKERDLALQGQAECLMGDVFVSAACIAYFGAFTGPYRTELRASWISTCRTLGIPLSQDVTLCDTLASPIEVRDWAIWGLPKDDVSIDNGILVTRGRRWPLMIDPQSQASTWVRGMEARAGLQALRINSANLLNALAGALRQGQPVILEVGETLDPALQPLLLKQVFKVGGRAMLRLGDATVEYNSNFRLYMTTKLSNPHFLPEVCVMVQLINFTVSARGLEDQLLGDVVRRERPDLEDTKDRLVLSISNDKRQLQDLEEKILKMLREAKGNILDDEALINTLDSSKSTSALLQRRVSEAEETERSINTAREHYRYQTSLAYFAGLFGECIAGAAPSSHLPTRLNNIRDMATRTIFKAIQRSLFEEHKLLFAFLASLSLARGAGELNDMEWSYFITGAAPTASRSLSRSTTRTRSRSVPNWLPESVRTGLCALESAVSAFHGICDSFASSTGPWQAWMAQSDADLYHLPEPWAQSLTSFQKLMFVKVLRQDKLLAACVQYVAAVMGPEYCEPAPWTLDDVFPATSPRTPIIFILSAGADPTAQLQRFAEGRGMIAGESLHLISLGQGQGTVADTMVTQATKSGHWVCLQNCHLARSWMTRLEALVEDLAAPGSPVHPNFRLWLSSMPSPDFPVSVLQSGLKLTNEPPKGVKANVARTYNAMTEGPFESAGQENPAVWKRLLYSLSFFHAVVQERRKFGPLGWNFRYDFSQADLECAMMNLAIFLAQPSIPWAAINHVIGAINYGGRVTDDFDRRCLLATLQQYISPAMMAANAGFTPSSDYTCPPTGTLDLYREHIGRLPAVEAPELFGLHPNAVIAFELREARQLVDAVLSIQPRVASTGGAVSPDTAVAERAAEVLRELPSSLTATTAATQAHNSGKVDSLAVVLRQEVERLNRLLDVMRCSLSDLQKAIKGLAVMSRELELMYTSVLNNQVPDIWRQVAYPSRKELTGWVVDLQQRAAFLQSWLQDGPPHSFWLPAFFFPQGFLTAVLQKHARSHSIAIDDLTLGVSVTREATPDGLTAPASRGVFIHGLWIDGARWDPDAQCLEDPLPGVMVSPLPVVNIIPVQNGTPPEGTFDCPLYKTSDRTGALSTTGQSTNFVSTMALPTRKGTSINQWVLRGVALLCTLDD